MLKERASLDQLAQQIRAACERVDTLYTLSSNSVEKRELISEAFQELFLLLEELRFAEKEMRVKNEELMSSQEIMEIERHRYQDLFEHAPDGYLVTDPRAVINDGNPAIGEMLQLPAEKLHGLSLLMFVCEDQISFLRECMSELQAGDFVRNLEVAIQPASGEPLHVCLTIGAVRSAEGSLIGLHWFIRDISRQKKAEEALEISEERFRSITQSARDAILVADESGEIISWNKGAQELFGYEEQEILNKQFLCLLGAQDRELYRQEIESFKAGGSAGIFGKLIEVAAARRDSSEFPIEMSLSTWKAGGKRFFSGILRDIGERKQAEETRAKLLERVLTAQEEDRRWIARELHDETGQSLSSLLVGLRMIEDARSLRKAKVEAGRLRMITSQTLDDLGRLAKGLRPIILDDLGLVVALKRHAADFERSYRISVDYKTRGIESDRLPLAVETALFRIAQESLNNVVRHAVAKNIRLHLQQNEDSIELLVQDDGCGFDVEAIMQPGTTENHLGIHGMRERAALLGGSLGIESYPGKGTSIRVILKKANIYAQESYK